MSDQSKEQQVVGKSAQVRVPGPKIIISGGPASGKGTQCDFIVKELNVVHLSSGDMLRNSVKSGSEEGLKAQEYMNRGELVPDEVIINIVAHRVMEPDCLERGFVLDGFPRTAAQVEALIAAGVQCDVFLQIDVDDEEIIRRVSGRRMDPETGKIYHMTYLPPPEDIAHRLTQRDDDTEEKVMVRLATYHNNLAEIIDNFAHCTVKVNTNNKKPQQIWSEFRKGMKRFVKFASTDVFNRRVPKIIISGGPASGKGTQCDFIVKEWNVVHLSSGDMLRSAIECGSEEGLKAQEYMNRGELVPDEVIINIVAHRVMEPDCLERGFVLDGFPRTAAQVEALIAAGVQCDVFLQIDVDDEAIVQRVSGRRMDPVTGKIYHMTYLPPPDEIKHRLKQRDDDTEEKIKVRLATYHRNLAGIINNFEHCTVAVNTNNKNPHQIWREFRQKMKRYLVFNVIFVLGAPSSGKTLLCQEVTKKCSRYRCISVPTLLAAEAAGVSEDADVIQQALAAGNDVPIALIIKLISKEMFQLFNSPAKVSKFIIDGFPSTISSVNKWYDLMGKCSSVDFFLYLDTPLNILEPRLQKAVLEGDAAQQITSYKEAVLPLLSMLDGSGKLRTLDGVMNPKVLVKEVITLINGVDIINPFERTFAIIKPDAVSDGKAHEIHKAIIEDGRLTVLASKLVHFDGKASEEFYVQEFKDSTRKNALKSFMKSGPSLCMILEGPDAICVWRAMLGPTDSRKAVAEAPMSFRALYGSDECRNAVHGSDSEGSAMREINFLLSPTGSGQRLASVLGTKADLNPLKDDCLSSFSREEKSSGGLVLEDTCAVLKPLTADLYYDEIISVIRSHGFEIISEVKTQLSEERSREFYAEHKDKPFFEQLIKYMCTRRVVSLHLRRVGAINAWRNLMGSVDLDKSRLDRPDSLRALFAIDSTKNAVGGSDSRDSAQREIAHYFSYVSAPAAKLFPEHDVSSLPPPVAAKTLPPIVGAPHSPVKKHRSPYELAPVSRGDMVDMNGYNKSKIHPVLGPVISKLIISRPSDVREFILQELQSPK